MTFLLTRECMYEYYFVSSRTILHVLNIRTSAYIRYHIYLRMEYVQTFFNRFFISIFIAFSIFLIHPFTLSCIPPLPCFGKFNSMLHYWSVYILYSLENGTLFSSQFIQFFFPNSNSIQVYIEYYWCHITLFFIIIIFPVFFLLFFSRTQSVMYVTYCWKNKGLVLRERATEELMINATTTKMKKPFHLYLYFPHLPLFIFIFFYFGFIFVLRQWWKTCW